MLFDQNLSHRLVKALCHDYPGSEHVRNIGLGEAADEAVWRYAAENGFILISKDADFHQRSFLFGHPPEIAQPRLSSGASHFAVPMSPNLPPILKGPFS
ncbi:DUF5615 family PIN-like protein [Nitrospira moscoviensis]|uniref:DUF5615 family PIN-like protein n=1 Tax=Nitrospira moscoviensis TaxID=42253 RepID=UPI001EE759AB|nr:DUF5615 family PIN-like protein [Nitrospira moscoviensis]